MHKAKTVYLGDGVYAEFRGYDIVLKTDRETEMHYIHIEPSALENLVRFAKASGWPISKD